jgi:hypothetical protein
MPARFSELIVDANDPAALAAFWAAVLEWDTVPADTANPEYEGEVEIRAPDGSLPTIVFVAVPEAKQVKDRIHIDVSPAGGSDQARELERLRALGAREIDIGQGEVSWIVLADPEGNEFCLLRTPLD